MDDHVHDSTVPICPCGHVWEYVCAGKNKDGSAYAHHTSTEVIQRYKATFGILPKHYVKIGVEHEKE